VAKFLRSASTLRENQQTTNLAFWFSGSHRAKSETCYEIPINMLWKRNKTQVGKSEMNPQTEDEELETQADSQDLNPSTVRSPSTLRFPKPKILVVDLNDDTAKTLKAAGYAVNVGSFGTPYKIVSQDNSYEPVVAEYNLPNYAEQEIVIIDLLPAKALEKPPKEKQAIEGTYGHWGKRTHGEIDPRPVSMAAYRHAFDKILAHGGAFIIFADYHTYNEIVYAQSTRRDLDIDRSKTFDNWSFLTPLHSSRFETKFTHGSEISVPNQSRALGKLLARHLKGASFRCTLAPKEHINVNQIFYTNEFFESWVVLATDKYGAPVAGVFAPGGDVKGWIFIFPQLSDKSSFIKEFLRDVLPELAPHLFPYAEGGKWIYRDDYQLPSILEMRQQVEQIEAEARERVKAVEEKIRLEQEETSYLRALLTETGDPLVKAVKKTLEILGFQSVIDMDEEMEKAGDTSGRREDLRILDEPTTLLVEVKGITGLPTDADALQVQKYVVVRMREWGRTNVQGLEIINHQKGIPALDRENEAPFRQDILVNAEEQQFGLITTWDLYRLARSYLKNNWKPEHVKALFLQFGRIRSVPLHYQFAGIVENFWEKVGVVGVRVKEANLRMGDRIAFELPVDFEEQEITSLQVENQQVELAEPSMLAGIKTDFTKQYIKKGMRVFKVSESMNKP
jgi:hypothetical protein